VFVYKCAIQIFILWARTYCVVKMWKCSANIELNQQTVCWLTCIACQDQWMLVWCVELVCL